MSRRKRSFLRNIHIDSETGRGIFHVLLIVFALLLFLSTFDLLGTVGVTIDVAFANAFGWDRILLPFFILAIAIHDITPEKFPLTISNYIGFILFYISMNPLVHTLAMTDGIFSPERLQKFGGKIGLLISEPIQSAIGKPGAVVIFTGIFITAILLIFNTSIRRLVAHAKFIGRGIYAVYTIFVFPFKWILEKRRMQKEEALRQLSEISNPAPIQEAVQEIHQDETREETDIGENENQLPKPLKRKKHQPRIEIPLELLSRRDQKPTSGDIVRNQHVIQSTLETFGVSVEMGDVSVGPTVTQFTLKPYDGVKIARITALHNDLALALAAHPIRIEAPIPGKSLVGIEVPNQSVATVGLREIFETKEWRERKQTLPIGLGRDVSGKPWITDLGRMPHVLVAGATGSGKSVCLNTLIMSFMYALGPDEVKFVMVDPKRVELQVYNGIPHLITPVITDTEKTVNALKWCMREMDRRFDVLQKFGVRDIASYNASAEEKLPFIVVVIDELADLMTTAMQEVEGPIVRLAQMSRAVGIHLVLATQRPSTDVITGLIKANIPARIAFSVASSIDSRTILDEMGAEKLLGRGDMLIKTAEMSAAKRLQGTYVSDDEIARTVEYIKSKYDPSEYDPEIIERAKSTSTSFLGGVDEGDQDPLIPDAKEEIIRAGKASASLLQRRMKIGYARAARILDLLEQDGFIGPSDGAKPREILHVQFTKELEQIATPMHPALEQVNREMPAIEDEGL